MRAVIIVSLMILSTSAHAVVLVKSAVTSIDSKSCLKVKGNVFDSQSSQLPYDYYENECPGLGGYQIITGGKDLRYSLAVKFGANHIDFEGPSQLHDLTSGSIEWRYEHAENQGTEMKALIFKLHTIDEQTLVNADYYYVVKLNKEKSCLIGKVPDVGNALEAARKMADDTKAKCL
jgi:hypothetical protein